jgi:hypothetical protein
VTKSLDKLLSRAEGSDKYPHLDWVYRGGGKWARTAREKEPAPKTSRAPVSRGTTKAQDKEEAPSSTTPADTAAGNTVFDLPFELREMIYDEIHQQEEVKTVGNRGGQLIVRYTPPPTRYQRAGKYIAAEIDSRIPKDYVHRLEITQKNLIFSFLDDHWGILPKRMLPHGTEATVILNFNINDCEHQETMNSKILSLFSWTPTFVKSWNARRRPSGTSPIATPVTLRLWFCSMDAFDAAQVQLDNMWETHKRYMHGVFRTLLRIEMMFYERDDFIALPDEDAKAKATTLQVIIEADGWVLDDEAVRLANEVAKKREYYKVDFKKRQWGDQSYSDYEATDEGGDSDGETPEESPEEDLDEDSDEDSDSFSSDSSSDSD